MNPFDGILTDYLKTQFKQAIDEIIRGYKVNCRFYMPITKYTECTDCSAPIYSNSPNPFLAGNKGKLTTVCATCGGTQQIPVENYTDLAVPVIFNYTKNKPVVPGIVFSTKGDAQTFSKIETISTIKACKYVIFDTDIQHTNEHIFTRDSEPVPMGFGEDKYILTTWRIGG